MESGQPLSMGSADLILNSNKQFIEIMSFSISWRRRIISMYDSAVAPPNNLIWISKPPFEVSLANVFITASNSGVREWSLKLSKVSVAIESLSPSKRLASNCSCWSPLILHPMQFSQALEKEKHTQLCLSCWLLGQFVVH